MRLFLLVFLVGCGDASPADPCPGGICPADAGFDAGRSGGDGGVPPGGDGGVPPGSDGGVPPGSDGGVPPGSDGGAGCVERWICTPWTTGGGSDDGTRSCRDLNACGTTVSRPAEAATLPHLDVNFYRCNVEPIFDRGCAHQGCHGTEVDRALRIYARGRHRIAGETWIEPGCLMGGTPHPSEECSGSIECRCWTLPHSAAEWQRNYDSARGFGLAADGTPLAAGSEASSELIQQPLIGGGYAHAGIHMFADGSPEYMTLLRWLQGATLATCTTRN